MRVIVVVPVLLCALCCAAEGLNRQGLRKEGGALQHEIGVEVSRAAMMKRQYAELSMQVGIVDGVLKRVVDGAMNAWTGFSNAFVRLGKWFGDTKTTTKYLLNMLQLKKPGGYTPAFCSHSKDECATVDNYPWPKSHSELTHAKVVEGLEYVSEAQRAGTIFRGNELGYLILNSQFWRGFGDDDFGTIGLGMSVEQHEKVRPVLDGILGHASSAWSKEMIKSDVENFLRNAPPISRARMKQTVSIMKENCKDKAGFSLYAKSNCKQCEALSYCDAQFKKRLGFIPTCKCTFDQAEAERQAEERDDGSDGENRRDVVRVQRDIKVWSTKLLHKIHMGIRLSNAEAEEFTDIQSTCLVATILPEGLVNKIKFVSKIDKIKEYRVKMIRKYQDAIRADERGLIPDEFKTDPELNFLLASNMLDSLLFAGGLSVPSVVGVGLAVLYAGENSPMSLRDRIALVENVDADAVSKFVFEVIRRFPPVVGFPWWSTPGKDGLRTVMNLAMAQRDPRGEAWGDDAESFKLRDNALYARLMGVSWAAPHSDWTAERGWTQPTSVNAHGGMARECPAKELSFVMAKTFLQLFLKDAKAKSWRVANNAIVHLTESTPFHTDFSLVRGAVENLGQCDKAKCELFAISKEEVDKEMLAATADLGIPPTLRGIFWMEGNPAPDELASFGGSAWTFKDFDGFSDASVDAEIAVYGNRVWSWHDTKLGRATYQKAAMSKLTYKFHCDEAVVHCDITISTRRRFMGGVGAMLNSAADFTMDLCTPDSENDEGMEKCLTMKTGDANEAIWIRKSKLFGMSSEHQYVLRRIVDGSGRRLKDSWKRFVDTVDDTMLLARVKNDATFDDFVAASEQEQRSAFDEAVEDLVPNGKGVLKRINPGQEGCRVDVECLQTRKCYGGRCQALVGQLGDRVRCRLDSECESGTCEGNRWGLRDGTCQGLSFGVEAPPVENKCRATENPQTCAACVEAMSETSETPCAWCAAFSTDSSRGQCVKSASFCPKGATYFASKRHPFNLDSGDDDKSGKGITWRTGAEVVPFDITSDRIDQCPRVETTRFEKLRDFFPSTDFLDTVLKNLAYKYATLDFFARANYNALVTSYHAWMQAMPTSSESVKTFDPPSSFSDHIEQGFAGIKICTHDEDWEPVTAKEKRLTGLITKIPEGWGRSNLAMHKDIDLKYFTYYWDGKDPNNENKPTKKLLDWGLGPLSTSPAAHGQLLLGSPTAKPEIFSSGRSDEWKDAGVDAESQAFVELYFDKLFPQPLATWSIEQLTSDKGLTIVFFDGPGVVFLRKIGSASARDNHAGGFGGGGNEMLLLETFSSTHAHPEGAVYVADLSYMANFAVRKCGENQPSCSDFVEYGFKLYFNAERAPIHIHTKHLGTSKPGDSKWEASKFAVRSSVITEITAIDHLLYSHLTVSNGGTRAATEKLGTEHPLRRLLKPFTFRANKINDQASRALFIRGGLVDRTFAFDPDVVGDYFDAMSKNFKFRTVPRFIEDIGVEESKSTVLTDMRRYWDVQRAYVDKFVDLYWKTDADVLGDDSIVEYWNFLESGARTIPYGLSDLSKEALVDQITHHMFWVTAMHKLVGNVADWLRTGARGFATVMRENNKLEADIQYFFVGSTIAGFTGLPQVNLINDWTHLCVTDEEKAVLKEWQDALRALAAAVDEDNTKREFPSNYVNPRFLDSSVAI